MYTPLFRLLKIVNADRRPIMDFVYGMLEDAKNEISYLQQETDYVSAYS